MNDATEPSTGFKALDEAAVAIETAADASSELAQVSATAMSDMAIETASGLAETAEETADVGPSYAQEISSAAVEVFDHAAADTYEAVDPLDTGAAHMPRGSFLGEFVSVAKDGMALQKSAFTRLISCRSPQQILALQFDLARETVTSMADASRKLGKASLQDLTALSSRALVAR